MTQPTLEQFTAYLEDAVSRFKAYYVGGLAKAEHPAEWPLQMPEADWNEQFTMWLVNDPEPMVDNEP